MTSLSQVLFPIRDERVNAYEFVSSKDPEPDVGLDQVGNRVRHAILQFVFYRRAPKVLEVFLHLAI